MTRSNIEYVYAGRDIIDDDPYFRQVYDKEGQRSLNQTRDICGLLSDLGLSYKEAKTLHREHLRYRKAQFDGRLLALKKLREVFEQFLITLLNSRKQKKAEIVHYPNVPESIAGKVSMTDDSFEYITDSKMLAKAAKGRGWCIMQKYYRDMLKNGEIFCFFSRKHSQLVGFYPNGGVYQNHCSGNSKPVVEFS